MSRTALFLCLTPLLFACAPKVETPAPTPERVSNETLGVAVAALPQGATVVANDATLAFDLSGPGEATRCQIEVGPEQRGVNLVEEIRGQRAAFEALEGGSYVGNTELMSPLGPAYAARGRFTGPAGAVEEVRLLTLHPSGNRLLVLRCAYPRTTDEDSKTRFGAIIGLLGELEGTTPAA